MRKSVIFVISVIGIIAIFVVAFFGVKSGSIENIIYINKIEILHDDITINESTSLKELKIFEYKANTTLPDSEIPAMEVRLKYKYLPDNVTPGHSDVEWSISNDTYAKVYQNGSVLILDQEKGIKQFSVYLSTKDGRNTQDKVKFIVNFNN